MEPKDFISATFSGAALVVSFLAFALTYRQSRATARAGRKPVLVFEYDGKRGWIINNVGGGPALNVIVAQKRVNGEWFNPVRIPPLARDSHFVPVWLGHVNTTGLGATYTDSENLPYTSTCGNDLSLVRGGKQFGPWQESQIGRHWSQPPAS